MEKQKLNRGWYFWKDGQEGIKKAVDLPHDAMLTEERVPDLENGNASGFYPGGKYVYTKNIYSDAEYENKKILVEFEGVYMNSSVFLNGEKIGGWVYGYTNFYVDLTDRLKIGRDNELKVIADNSQTPNSRWYSGSGIYRDVNLYVGEKEYVVPDGIRVTTVSHSPAVIRVETETVREEGTEVICEIYDGSIKKAEGQGDSFEIEIPDAKLWSAEEPNLYVLRVSLVKERKTVDVEEIKFGIRTLAWDAEKGFQVNGKTVKLKGGCIHHDNGPLGACSYHKAEYRRVKKLKELGFNAIRYSHNPTGRVFLEICDELGMYVLEETFDQWKLPQSSHDYAQYFDAEWQKDVRAIVRKDYSHASVIMYCVGNEITDTGLPHGALICQAISGLFKELDESRPTTIANNVLLSVMAKKMAEKKAQEESKEEKTVGSQDVKNVLTLLPKIMASITAQNQEALLHDVFQHVDIVGYNYGESWYAGTHEMVPDRVMLSSETFPCRIGENWKRVLESPYLIGDFMWTAWDYLGEAGVGLPFYGSSQAPFSKEYPCLTAGCGSVDLTGYVESQGYYTSIVFGEYEKPYIAVRPVNHSGEEYTVGRWRLTDAVNSWTWLGCEGKTADIEVYSKGNEIELFQDGVSLGRKSLELCRASFQTTYQPGVLEAISFDVAGAEIAREYLVSASGKKQITIIPEEREIRADGQDLAYINIQITDGDRIPWMMEDQKLSVTVEGAGKLLALGSGNPETVEKFSDTSYTTYHGRLLAIVQATEKDGDIRIQVCGEGLQRTEAVLYAR